MLAGFNRTTFSATSTTFRTVIRRFLSTNNNNNNMRLTTANLTQIKEFEQTDGSGSTSTTTANTKKKNVPYNRAAVTPGILHVGVGNFYKGHLATYMHNLLEMDEAANLSWGIVGAGVHPAHVEMQASLKEQDCLFTVIERSATAAQPTIVGSMIDCLAYDSSSSSSNTTTSNSAQEQQQHKPIQELMLDPKIKIVSMTVTEGGYFLAGEENTLDTQHVAIVHDAQHPDQPRTLFGVILQALRKRRAAGIPPFTVLSCDNIVHNGDVVKSVVVGLAKLQQEHASSADKKSDNNFVEWMEQNVTFPNSMVDRITPVTTADEKAHGTFNDYGFHDRAVVYCEPWRQWVLEDNFCNGRPAFEQLESVDFVTDVTPFELMKIRILNGGHAALCYPAALLELEFIHDAMQHPILSKFLDKLERTEIVPQVGAVPGKDTLVYWQQTEERFRNPTILDSIARNCRDGSARQPKFIVPTAIDNVNKGVTPKGLALVSALWCRYCAGTTEKTGKAFAPNCDVQWARLNPLAIQAKEGDPKQWLIGLHDIYADLSTNEVFVEAFTEALNTIYKDGVEAALQAYVDEK